MEHIALDNNGNRIVYLKGGHEGAFSQIGGEQIQPEEAYVLVYKPQFRSFNLNFGFDILTY